MNYYSGKDLARNHRVVRKNTLQLAEEIPDAQYAFRATPDSRSVAETLAHVAASSRWPHQMHGVEKKTAVAMEDFGRYMQEAGIYEASLKTKADIVAALEKNGREFADWLETLSDADLGTHDRISAAGRTLAEIALRDAAGREGTRNAPSRPVDGDPADARHRAAPDARASGPSAAAGRHDALARRAGTTPEGSGHEPGRWASQPTAACRRPPSFFAQHV